MMIEQLAQQVKGLHDNYTLESIVGLVKSVPLPYLELLRP